MCWACCTSRPCTNWRMPPHPRLCMLCQRKRVQTYSVIIKIVTRVDRSLPSTTQKVRNNPHMVKGNDGLDDNSHDNVSGKQLTTDMQSAVMRKGSTYKQGFRVFRDWKSHAPLHAQDDVLQERKFLNPARQATLCRWPQRCVLSTRPSGPRA